MSQPPPPEEELLARLRASGSPEERRQILELILTPYLDRVARWALRICSDPDEAAEIAQDALLSVCSHIDQFRGECRFSTWLFTIVRNQGRRRGPKSARSRHAALPGALDPESPAPSPEDALERKLRVEKFSRLLNSELTPLEARIFLLHFADEIPLAVLDRRLGLTNRSGARAHLISAKRKLRRKMRDLEASVRARGRLRPAGLWDGKGADDE